MDKGELCKLNRFKLDEESEKAAATLQTYSTDSAKARIKAMRAEMALKTLLSATELEIRRGDPAKYGLGKFTEDSIKALVETDLRVIDAKNEMLEAKEEQYDLESLVEGLREKCSQIKNEISLWIGGYFAEPSNVDQNKRSGALGR
jgi:hypothetical protein